MDEQESAPEDAQPVLDGSEPDEPPEDHERRPDAPQPTAELRWTKAVIRGTSGTKHERRRR